MAIQFKKATKTRAKLRLALMGPSGSGKTFSALKIATYLGGRIAVIDTERGSASKYAAEVADPEKGRFAFEVLELESFHPKTYIEAVISAAAAGFDVIIIDSLSHAWNGKGGALEMVDNAARKGGNSYTAWRDVTPLHNALVDSLVSAKAHVIATMRSKMEYVLETNEKGKQVPKKVGMQPIQRDGLEYEFDVTADMTLDNEMLVGKTRCPALAGQVFQKPGKEVADTLKAWLSDGAGPEEKPVPTAPKSDPYTVSATLSAAYIQEIVAAATVDALEEIGSRVAESTKARKLANADIAKIRTEYAKREGALMPETPAAAVAS